MCDVRDRQQADSLRDSARGVNAAPDRFVSVAKLLALVFGALALTWLVAGLSGAAGINLWLTVIVPTAFYGIAAGFAWLLLRGNNLDWRRFVGSRRTGAWRVSALSGVCTAALTYGCVWLVYVPLSFVAPDYTLTWLTDSAELLVRDGERLVFWPNVALVGIVVVLAPAVEEFLFRGLLLHRLAERLGVPLAVGLSGLLFGLVHDEVLGHTLFGVAAALLYLRTGSLWAPIILHAANNTVAVGLELTFIESGYEVATLSAFRAGWPYGLLGLLIGVPWFVWMLRVTWPAVRARLPYDRNFNDPNAQDADDAGSGSSRVQP